MKNKKVLIIGGGIAGLCTGIYLRKSGFETEILEMHSMAGGLATAWKRNGYTFENCIHWLVGSKGGEDLNSTWKEVMDLHRLEFYSDPIYQVIESGDTRLVIYRNVDRMEHEFLARAPEDALAIKEFAKLVRQLSSLKLPGGDNPFVRMISYIKATPYLWILRKYTRFSMAQYAVRFTHPLLKRFFSSALGDLSLLAIAFSLAWMTRGNAGYPIGGSLKIIGLIEEQYKKLGGSIHFGAKVERIIVENGSAVGIILENGNRMMADAVVSAADIHTTLFHFLQGQYLTSQFEGVFKNYKPFPSYVQVSLGVGAELKDEPGLLSVSLENKIEIDPKTREDFVTFRIFNYDPTLAPAGKTTVTCFLPTFNHEYWYLLRETDKARYEKEKLRIAEAITSVFEERYPAVKGKIEVVDVATPATIIRYTGNWKGSMEGWLLTPETGIKQLPHTLPQLKNFYMAGQWLSPGGGLPAGLLTARKAALSICRSNKVKFRTASLKND
jgi:phytoene dehydrogenase-like protein